MSTTVVIATLGWALLISRPEAITELDGHVVAFESQPWSSSSGAVSDFVFRVWPVGGSEAASPFIRVRYVWGEDAEPPPEALRSADRMLHIAVTREPKCDANIDDLLYRKVLLEDGSPTPMLVNLQQASGRHAEALPTGAVLPCYLLRPGDAR